MLGCGCVYKILTKEIPLSPVVQALVQARKAGIASAMAARSSIKDEELVNIPLKCFYCHYRLIKSSVPQERLSF